MKNTIISVMSEALESTAVDTNMLIGGGSQNKLDSGAKKRAELKIPMDGCILELCSTLHLTSAVQGTSLHVNCVLYSSAPVYVPNSHSQRSS